jgi:hypothetical protein
MLMFMCLLLLGISGSLKNYIIVGQQWLMPIILATQEAEIRRIMVPGQPGQIVHETLSQKNPSQKGLVELRKV